ncbi:hypothetical protein [Bacillus cereus]|uniref:hypothetical protein n=1 Tax=Bacillus cereus TaxID=1396 RepID=UPI000937738E|nr:hypothetical protein [Bacillus cereus]OKA19952.1 hypothetical protein BJR05_26775 [Bacillus cereus]
MTVQTEDLIVEEMKEWKEKLLLEQTERKEKLKELEFKLEVSNAKKHCLVQVKYITDSRLGAQQDISNATYDQEVKRNEELRTAIEVLKAAIHANDEVNKLIIYEIDKGIRENEKNK